MYVDENTNWRFTVPQAGEVDSAEMVEKRMEEIDAALIGPMGKAELFGQGRPLTPSKYPDGDSSTYSKEPDNFWSRALGRPVYTTSSHYHPVPEYVVNAESADRADTATTAETAKQAEKLKNGITINGHKVDGGSGSNSVTLDVRDIGAPKVFWGSQKPSSVSISGAKAGDLYVQVL